MVYVMMSACISSYKLSGTILKYRVKYHMIVYDCEYVDDTPVQRSIFSRTGSYPNSPPYLALANYFHSSGEYRIFSNLVLLRVKIIQIASPLPYIWK